jgi:hypothetical protein
VEFKKPNVNILLASSKDKSRPKISSFRVKAGDKLTLLIVLFSLEQIRLN